MSGVIAEGSDTRDRGSDNMSRMRTRTVWKAAAVGALLVGGMTVLVASPAGAGTPAGPWYVNFTTGNDANSCLSPTQACATIAEALLDEESLGSSSQNVINVAAGLDHEPPVTVTSANGDLSIIGAGQILKRRKTATVFAPRDASGCATAAGGALLNLQTSVDVTVSNIVISGSDCTGQSAGLATGTDSTVTLTTVASGADYGVVDAVGTANLSSDTIGSLSVCTTTANEESAGTIVAVSNSDPRCAKGYTAINVEGVTESAFPLNKREIEVAASLTADNGDTVYFNTTPLGYLDAGILCTGAGIVCNVSDSAILGGGSALSIINAIVITNGAVGNLSGNTVD